LGALIIKELGFCSAELLNVGWDDLSFLIDYFKGRPDEHIHKSIKASTVENIPDFFANWDYWQTMMRSIYDQEPCYASIQDKITDADSKIISQGQTELTQFLKQKAIEYLTEHHYFISYDKRNYPISQHILQFAEQVHASGLLLA
jgi:hypothetical protein